MQTKAAVQLFVALKSVAQFCFGYIHGCKDIHGAFGYNELLMRKMQYDFANAILLALGFAFFKLNF